MKLKGKVAVVTGALEGHRQGDCPTPGRRGGRWSASTIAVTPRRPPSAVRRDRVRPAARRSPSRADVGSVERDGPFLRGARRRAERTGGAIDGSTSW